MPAAEVKLYNREEALGGVFDARHGEQRLRVCHEAGQACISFRFLFLYSTSGWRRAGWTHLVILSSMERGSRIKVGRVILLRSAPGRNCEMMWVRTCLALALVHDGQG